MSELLNLIDGQVEIEEDVTLFVDGQEQKQEWKITDDTTADWWIERKQEELKDIERLKEQIRAKIDFYQSRLDAECKKEEFIKGDMNSRLIEYFESIPDDRKKKTKTLIKYQLPTGTLQKKFKSPTYIKDDAELLKYAKENAPDFIEMKVLLKWGEFKKQTKVVNGQVVDTNTGEVLPIRLEEQAPVFEVKL